MKLTEWINALEEAELPPEGFASRDLRMFLHISEDGARKLLRSWMEEDRIVHAGFRTDHGIDGRKVRVPIYIPKGAQNGSPTQSRKEVRKQEVRQAAQEPGQARRKATRPAIAARLARPKRSGRGRG